MANGYSNQRRGGHGGGRGGFGEAQDIEPIPSPYNFVPLAEQVFFPDRAENVSMDVPFSDGISGTLQITVTARTPIYIRNGGTHPEGQARLVDNNYTDFFRVHPGGPYAIPGTSLKGMLRSVVEIVSFGKIVGGKSAPRVTDHRYAVRDLHNSEVYGKHITEEVCNAFRPKVQAAWLSEVGDDHAWQLTLCDFSRVEQEDLEPLFGVMLGNKQDAASKYRQLARNLDIRFDPDPIANHGHHTTRLPLRYSLATNLSRGNTQGRLVLTGQPSDRKPRGCVDKRGRRCSRGKHMEFIFFNEKTESVPVPDPVKNDFEFAHSVLGENRKPNPEWKFWKERLHRGERVPVFVLFENNRLHSMGLAMMYRFPYTHSIHETIAHTGNGVHLDGSRLDLAELIFGRVEGEDGIRGRVAIETLLAEGNPTLLPPETTVLGAPKPTYYPNYIQQKVGADGRVGRYQTYMDKTAEIRGWKRYISRPADQVAAPRPGPDQANVATAFRPLDAGTAFVGCIHLHNLRLQELGALLWAITWGGNRNLRHSLGMGKPYGFGSVTVEIASEDLRWCDPARNEPVTHEACLKAYKDLMKAEIPNWESSDLIRALKVMADPTTTWPQEIKRYPSLSAPNEFVKQRGRDVMHALVDPLGVGHRQNSGSVQPHSMHTTRRPSLHQPPASAKPAELTPEDRFLAELDKLSLGEIPKRMKSLDLDPAKVPVAKRREIYQKLKKKPGAGNWNFQPILKAWRID